MDFRTADLCDQHADGLDVCEPLFRDYGGRRRFAGPLATIKCFEDNSRVRDLIAEAGHGRVLVIDAGGSTRRAVLGDLLAQKAVDNGWAGIVIYGCLRDSAAITAMPLGVKAIGTCPLKTDKRGEGQRDVPVRFAGVQFHPGDWLYADEDGIVVARRSLLSQ
jgi:regulator of ribonuclease activity A